MPAESDWVLYAPGRYDRVLINLCMSSPAKLNYYTAFQETKTINQFLTNMNLTVK